MLSLQEPRNRSIKFHQILFLVREWGLGTRLCVHTPWLQRSFNLWKLLCASVRVVWYLFFRDPAWWIMQRYMYQQERDHWLILLRAIVLNKILVPIRMVISFLGQHSPWLIYTTMEEPLHKRTVIYRCCPLDLLMLAAKIHPSVWYCRCHDLNWGSSRYRSDTGFDQQASLSNLKVANTSVGAVLLTDIQTQITPRQKPCYSRDNGTSLWI